MKCETLFFGQIKIISICLHEMSNPILCENKENINLSST